MRNRRSCNRTLGFSSTAKPILTTLTLLLGADLDSDEFDTIGGYVFGLFGRQPTQGDSIDESGYRFAVAETDGRRIMKLRVDRVAEGEAAPQ